MMKKLIIIFMGIILFAGVASAQDDADTAWKIKSDVSLMFSQTAFNNWARISGAGFPEGPAIRTPYSVYLGFGLEAIDTASNRNAVMDRVMKYLGQ